MVGLRAKTNPSVFTDADPALAPWITPARVENDGMLVVWEEGPRDRALPEALQLLVGQSARFETFRWPSLPKAREIVIGYVIIPPLPPD